MRARRAVARMHTLLGGQMTTPWMSRKLAEAAVSDAGSCGCVFEEPDGGLVLSQCAEHQVRSYHLESRMRSLLDAEVDEVVRELAGRSPTRIERKPGAVGSFAIARGNLVPPVEGK